MFKYAALIFLLTAGLLTAAATYGANASDNPLACTQWEGAKKLLNNQYGEVAVAAGVAKSGGLTVLFLNSITQTYTIVSRSAEGVTCILDEGQNFTPVQHKPNGIEG